MHLHGLAAADTVIKSLFGDGFIGYCASPQDQVAQSGQRGLKIVALADRLVPDSLDDMGWTLGPRQFKMTLSRQVPLRIRDDILAFVCDLCAQAGLEFAREKGRMVYAIHPGGPAILDHVRDALGLREQQLRPSQQVLRLHGNMVSATIPHIWKEIIDSPAAPVGAPVLSLGFGPGLTVTGALLEKV
jgi:predicted naringenin-chalcone synthase